MLVRRTLLLGAGSLVVAPVIDRAAKPAVAQVALDLASPLAAPFSVPPLPYPYDANEPAIDTETMQLHHDKHHATYVSNLNAAVKDHPELATLPLHELLARIDTLPEATRTVVRNNGGGHANHPMFWQVMGGNGGEPVGDVGAAIIRDFGSFANLQTNFNATATKVFGSGWAMVVVDRAGRLSLVAKPNQDSPIMEGKRALFGNDVWEHAYYLKYQNRRIDYLKAWWSVLDWGRVSQRYAAAKAGTLLI
jgi:Fe-Mn family superoxide dismutase